MAIDLQTILNGVSQSLEGGNTGTLQTDAAVTSGVDTVLKNVKADLSGAGTGIGSFLGKIGLGGLVGAASTAAGNASTTQEKGLISTVLSSLPSSYVLILAGGLALGLWLVLRRR